MLRKGASSVGGDDGTWKVVAFNSVRMLGSSHGREVSGEYGGLRGSWVEGLIRLRRWGRVEGGGILLKVGMVGYLNVRSGFDNSRDR